MTYLEMILSEISELESKIRFTEGLLHAPSKPSESGEVLKEVYRTYFDQLTQRKAKILMGVFDKYLRIDRINSPTGLSEANKIWFSIDSALKDNNYTELVKIAYED